MEQQAFGDTGLSVSPLGFGGSPFAFLGTEQERVSTILNLLLDAGVNVIDTAAMYPGSEVLAKYEQLVEQAVFLDQPGDLLFDARRDHFHV